ncbi:uncharacterized protein LOC116849886 [Odontomachus brunneus]|uniref:uncharacterized protein LOC116849886 n=1 Tax=Odontomachus brunneus TaxID=486640 RepID=UPI0013F1961B|nr:uncharacterized protein LOC116849886 [Odontomachus brunneus]
MSEEDYYNEDEGNESIGNNVSEEREIYIRTFIHFVYPNTQLYIKKSKGYSKCQYKSLTWASVGAAMTPKITGLQAEKLFHRLHEKFGKERKKIIMSMPRSGAGAGMPTYQSTWIFYNDLLFLADHIIARQTSNFQPPVVRPQSSVVQSQLSAVQGKQSLHVPLDKQSPLSPMSNPDFNYLCSSPSCSSDSDKTNTTGTNISYETEGKEYAIEEASESTASTAILKTMTASIQPAKTVPPKDPIKKRKRDSEKTNDVLSQSSKDVSFLAASLGAALERFGPLQPVQPASCPGRPNMSSDIEAMLGFVAVALSSVPEEKRVSCVMDMVAVVKGYTKKHSGDYESETSCETPVLITKCMNVGSMQM